jgi:hypothetical protein
MKKFLSLVLAIIMSLSLFSCGTLQPDSNSTQGTQAESSTNDTEKQTHENGNTSNTDKLLSAEERAKIRDLLSELLSGYKANPRDIIPKTMLETNESKVVDKENIPTDYKNGVSVSSIPTTAVGAQWKMVLDNINQTNDFFNVLSVADKTVLASTSLIAAFFEKEDINSPRYTFNVDNYSITVDYDGAYVYYVMELNTIQISMKMDVNTKVKTVRIQLTDTNALSYTIEANTYTFAISYASIRQAFTKITKNSDNSIEGYIYEYALVHKFANFYINDNYATVLGDALDNNVVTDDYVLELYDTKTRELIAFETQETTGIINKKQVSTIWLNLRSIKGINSISYGKFGEDDDKGFYINGSSAQWVAGEEVDNRCLFDIEFMEQYFFYLDDEDFKDKKEDVPMLRIQAAKLSDITSVVKKANPSVDISVNLSSEHINKLTSDYAKYINESNLNKNKVTSSEIIALVGTKTVFI